MSDCLSAEVALRALEELYKHQSIYTPKTDRLVRAYTPNYYPGHLDGAPPPYITAYESHDNATPSVTIIVRSVANKDGTPGPVSCIEIHQPEFREFLTYCARWLGWLPITEEQWMRYYQQHARDDAINKATVDRPVFAAQHTDSPDCKCVGCQGGDPKP